MKHLLAILLAAGPALAVDRDELTGRWEARGEEVTQTLTLDQDGTMTYAIITPDGESASHGTWALEADLLTFTIQQLTVDGFTADIEPETQVWAVDLAGDTLTLDQEGQGFTVILQRVTTTAVSPISWGQVKSAA